MASVYLGTPNCRGALVLSGFSSRTRVALGTGPQGRPIVKARALRVNGGVSPRLDTKRGMSATLLVLSWLTGAISCGDSGTAPGSDTGQIDITTSTTGANIDPDGFTVTIDGQQNQSIGSNGTATFSSLAAGDHELELLGVSANCTVEGDNPRTVTVSAGGTSTMFHIICAPTGAVEVMVSTTGVDIDPDGYLVTVEGSQTQSIGVDGTVAFSDITAGDHLVELTGLAPNCSVGDDNPRTLNVPAGNTAQTAFAVTCTATTGSISVSASTTGVDPDPDGYLVEISGVGTSRTSPIGANTTVVVPDLAPGAYDLTLSGLASNCSWTPSVDAFKEATVSVGTTTPVTFDVTCFDAPLGTLRVRASTTGSPPFPVYFVGIDGQEVGAVGAVNGAADFRVPAGAHQVALDVGGCTVADGGRTVDVISASTVETIFDVTC